MDFLNVIVDNGNVRESDEIALFGPIKHECKGCWYCREEDVLWVDTSVTIFDLLIRLGAFKSKSQARKNWKHGNNIPPGWSEFKIGKIRRHLCIWNPTE